MTQMPLCTYKTGLTDFVSVTFLPELFLTCMTEQRVHTALFGAHIILIPTLAFRVMTGTCCGL